MEDLMFVVSTHLEEAESPKTPQDKTKPLLLLYMKTIKTFK